MALRACVSLQPGDTLQLQFPTSTPLRVTAVVRNRTGDCLGLEFLTQLPPDDRAMDSSMVRPNANLSRPATVNKPAYDLCSAHTVYARLRCKQQELRQVQREIDALHMAILLLADDEKELQDCLGRIVRHRTREVGEHGFKTSKSCSERQHVPNTTRSRLGP